MEHLPHRPKTVTTPVGLDCTGKELDIKVRHFAEKFTVWLKSRLERLWCLHHTLVRFSELANFSTNQMVQRWTSN